MRKTLRFSSTLSGIAFLGIFMRLPLAFLPPSCLATALIFLACHASAATLYKCTSNGEVTYANEPCKGQKMEVVKGKDTNMVHVNGAPPTAADNASAEVPVVKLQPKTDSGMGDAAALGLGAAAPAGKSADGSSANERFLRQLQAQTQALAQQQAQQQAQQAGGAMPADASVQEQGNEADWPEALRLPSEANAAKGQAPAGFGPLVMPTGAEIVAELRKSWQTEWQPLLKQWAISAFVCLLLLGILLLFALYWIVRLAVKHGTLAAQNTPPKRLQMPPMPQVQLQPMPKIDPKN